MFFYCSRNACSATIMCEMTFRLPCMTLVATKAECLWMCVCFNKWFNALNSLCLSLSLQFVIFNKCECVENVKCFWHLRCAHCAHDILQPTIVCFPTNESTTLSMNRAQFYLQIRRNERTYIRFRFVCIGVCRRIGVRKVGTSHFT